MKSSRSALESHHRADNCFAARVHLLCLPVHCPLPEGAAAAVVPCRIEEEVGRILVVVDGSYQLALSTPSKFVQGDYEVTVHYLAAARLNINHGVISVYPS